MKAARKRKHLISVAAKAAQRRSDAAHIMGGENIGEETLIIRKASS